MSYLNGLVFNNPLQLYIILYKLYCNYMVSTVGYWINNYIYHVTFMRVYIGDICVPLC